MEGDGWEDDAKCEDGEDLDGLWDEAVRAQAASVGTFPSAPDGKPFPMAPNQTKTAAETKREVKRISQIYNERKQDEMEREAHVTLIRQVLKPWCAQKVINTCAQDSTAVCPQQKLLHTLYAALIKYNEAKRQYVTEAHRSQQCYT